MTPVFVVQPEAEAEILEAFRWYEDKRAGLGLEFVRIVEACFAAIERYPHSYPIVRGQVRRAVLRRFPYNVFYLADAEKIAVIGCIQANRDPATWQRRIDTLPD